MTARRALVQIGGEISELPAGDTLVGGSGSASISTVEIDFGTPAKKEKKFTVVDASVSPTSKIIAQQSFEAATGKSEDENEMDFLQCRAVAGTGQFTLYVSADPGPVSGKFKINYLIG